MSSGPAFTRWGIRSGVGPSLLISLVGTGMWLAVSERPDRWWFVAGVCLAAAVVSMVTYRRRTLFEWAVLRSGFRRSIRSTAKILSFDGKGIVWDGASMTMYVEPTPRPYTISVLHADGTVDAPRLPLDDIRGELVQFDIYTESITVVSVGGHYAADNQVAEICHGITGTVDVPAMGRTLIEVKISLARSLDSVYSRGGKRHSLDLGMSKTVAIASARVQRRLQESGWQAAILSRAQLRSFSKGLISALSDPLDGEQWSVCKGRRAVATVFTPKPGAWTQRWYREWCRVPALRTITVIRLAKDTRMTDSATVHLAYLTSADEGSPRVETLGLWRDPGQQGAVLTSAVPSVVTAPVTGVHSRIIARDDPFPVDVYPPGIGVFAGSRDCGDKVFVNLSSGSKDPFYVVAPEVYLQQLLIRILAAGISVDVRVQSETLEKFVSTVAGQGGIGYFSVRAPGVVVVSDRDSIAPEKPGQTVLVWTTRAPTVMPTASIVIGSQESAVTVSMRQELFRWTITDSESRVLTVQSAARQKDREPVSTTPP